MPFVKLAVLVMLIGGVQRVDESGTSIRGQVHLLIVGDPGTGIGCLSAMAITGSRKHHILHRAMALQRQLGGEDNS